MENTNLLEKNTELLNNGIQGKAITDLYTYIYIHTHIYTKQNQTSYTDYWEKMTLNE